MASIQLRVFSTAILISLIGVACGSSDDEAAPVTTTVAAEVLGDVETDDPSTTVPATTTVPPTSAPTTAPTTTAAPERDFSAIDPIVSTFVDERGLNGAGLVIVDREDGIGKAIRVLQEAVDFDEFILVYHHEADPTDASLHFKRVHDGALIVVLNENFVHDVPP